MRGMPCGFQHSAYAGRVALDWASCPGGTVASCLQHVQCVLLVLEILRNYQRLLQLVAVRRMPKVVQKRCEHQCGHIQPGRVKAEGHRRAVSVKRANPLEHLAQSAGHVLPARVLGSWEHLPYSRKLAVALQ